MFVVLVLINSNNTVVNTCDFEIFFEFELEHFKFGVEFMQRGTKGVFVDDFNE